MSRTDRTIAAGAAESANDNCSGVNGSWRGGRYGVPLDFADRHVVVFGGTTGINFGIAGTFAGHACNFDLASMGFGYTQGKVQA